MSTWEKPLVTGLWNCGCKHWDCEETLWFLSFFAVLLLVLSQQVSHQSQTELIFELDFVKHYIKSCSKMHILCLLHPCHSPALYSPTAVTSLIGTGETIHVQDYPHKKRHRLDCISIKWSSLTHPMSFFRLFRNLDFKSHSITRRGCGSPIYCSQKRKSSPLPRLPSCCLHPSWPALSAGLSGNSLIKDKYFRKPPSECSRTWAFHPLSTGEWPQEVELLHKSNQDLQVHFNALLLSS